MSVAVIWVSNLDRSVKFYETLLSAKCDYQSDGFASVIDGHNEVLLHLLPQEYRAEPSYGEANPIKPVFEVEDIDGLYQSISVVGGSLQPLSQTHGNWRYVDGTDPDGHVIQVRQRV